MPYVLHIKKKKEEAWRDVFIKRTFNFEKNYDQLFPFQATNKAVSFLLYFSNCGCERIYLSKFLLHLTIIAITCSC